MADESCGETFDLGPFRFECVLAAHAHRRDRDGTAEHRSSSPRMAGDCELTWWTTTHDLTRRGD